MLQLPECLTPSMRGLAASRHSHTLHAHSQRPGALLSTCVASLRFNVPLPHVAATRTRWGLVLILVLSITAHNARRIMQFTFHGQAHSLPKVRLDKVGEATPRTLYKAAFEGLRPANVEQGLQKSFLCQAYVRLLDLTGDIVFRNGKRISRKHCIDTVSCSAGTPPPPRTLMRRAAVQASPRVGRTRAGVDNHAARARVGEAWSAGRGHGPCPPSGSAVLLPRAG